MNKGKALLQFPVSQETPRMRLWHLTNVPRIHGATGDRQDH